jgi:hypothetical protein
VANYTVAKDVEAAIKSSGAKQARLSARWIWNSLAQHVLTNSPAFSFSPHRWSS